MKPTAKNKQKAHIIALFSAMINKIPVNVDRQKFNSHYIQRINLDGECDIYSTDFNEVVMYDIEAKRISI